MLNSHDLTQCEMKPVFEEAIESRSFYIINDSEAREMTQRHKGHEEHLLRKNNPPPVAPYLVNDDSYNNTTKSVLVKVAGTNSGDYYVDNNILNIEIP